MNTIDLSLHLVTDHRLPFARVVEVVDAAAGAGVGVIQFRDKTASGRALFDRATALADVIAGRAAFVIDDRVDIARAARDAGVRVDGVHLGQSDLPVASARRLLGTKSLIGWTANTPEHFAAADALPPGTLDYLGVGVIRATSTKPDHPKPLGVHGFAALVASTVLPCVAIGGIGLDDIAALRRAGAAGVAVVSAVSGADDPAAASRALREAWS